MRNQVETPSGRILYIRAPKRLSRAQIADALASMADDDPRWLAVHQLIDEELATVMFDATDRVSVNREHAAGQAYVLMALKQRLLDERKRPMEPSAKPMKKPAKK
jgi:hypothetical protein